MIMMEESLETKNTKKQMRLFSCVEYGRKPDQWTSGLFLGFKVWAVSLKTCGCFSHRISPITIPSPALRAMLPKRRSAMPDRRVSLWTFDTSALYLGYAHCPHGSQVMKVKVPDGLWGYVGCRECIYLNLISSFFAQSFWFRKCFKHLKNAGAPRHNPSTCQELNRK